MIYSKPKASIRTNDVISKLFRLHQGTKQGCPNSGFIFNLIIEPLAEKIRSEKKIKGIKIGDVKHHCIVMTPSFT